MKNNPWIQFSVEHSNPDISTSNCLFLYL